MKLENAIKKLGKIGEVQKSGLFYYVKKDNKKITVIDNGGTGEITCCHCDYYDESGDKYHTSYYDNLTQMIKHC